MAHTNDAMLAELQRYYSSTATIGDLTHRLKFDSDFDLDFGGATSRRWYTAALDTLGVSYSTSLHLGDLANVFWSQTTPLTTLAGGAPPAPGSVLGAGGADVLGAGGADILGVS